jgi:hypothetical protein
MATSTLIRRVHGLSSPLQRTLDHCNNVSTCFYSKRQSSHLSRHKICSQATLQGRRGFRVASPLGRQHFRRDHVRSPDRIQWNNFGLVYWKDWRGLLGDIMEAYFRRTSIYLHYIDRFHTNSIAAQLRADQTGSQNHFRSVWFPYYRAVIVAYQSLLRYDRIVHDTSVLQFLLRTSPEHIVSKLDLQRYMTEHFALNEDIKSLSVIMLCKTQYPENSLFFKAQTQHLQIGGSQADEKEITRMHKKQCRQQQKADGAWDEEQFEYGTLKGLKGASMTKDVMTQFDQWSESWIAEGFHMTLRLDIARLKSRRAEISIVTKFSIKTSQPGPRAFRIKWHSIFKDTCVDLLENFRSLYVLNDELAALRHLRVHRYPSRDMQREITRERALYARRMARMEGERPLRIRHLRARV